METMKISHVSRSLGISTRMLRYYEQAGLIESLRRDDYAYRIYDETALAKLRQILILRKLRIPVKQIKVILQKADAVAAIEIFRQNINELDAEITALSTIRSILSRFIDELQETANIEIHNLVAQDKTLLASIESLSLTSINFMEDKTMERLKKAEESLSKLNDVRITYLPPATVASAHYIGDDPESYTYKLIDQFVRDTNLSIIKPDLRHYGFNHPNPVDETGYHGYETWVTIPEDWEVPVPLIKKHFAGGLYAAHMIAFGNFNEWQWLFDWVEKSEQYEFAGDMQDQEHMCGLLEEHLNYLNHVHLDNTEPKDLQLDLLMPIRERA
ncbi:DNA-binding transcriptional MerR regulator [Desulfitobacterium sp. LBE]|uniref:MerR family transcriptional regulator n=1 Tax=Desulfitobacterium TaxID=36853 RepID=UPI00036068D0|nr:MULTISPECIES: effector binding domain-containing protein [Desulfitobacterium]TWH58471.1 DNA-binding transcriptional MerR regulator [Desulfitobacterium sp. LBE]